MLLRDLWYGGWQSAVECCYLRISGSTVPCHSPLPTLNDSMWLNFSSWFTLMPGRDGPQHTDWGNLSVSMGGLVSRELGGLPSCFLLYLDSFWLVFHCSYKKWDYCFELCFISLKKNQLSPDLLCKSFSLLSPAFSLFLGVILWVDFSLFKGFEWKEGTSGFGREIVMASPEVLLLSGVLPVDQDKDYYANSK